MTDLAIVELQHSVDCAGSFSEFSSEAGTGSML